MIYLNTSTNTATNFNPVEAILKGGILIVEDCSVQRKAVVNWLQGNGIETIYEADDGHKALTLAEELDVPPAVILLDLELPGMDGIELLQELAVKQIRPAVIVASSVDEILIGSVASMVKALKFPLLGAFCKPCEPSALMDSLRRFEYLPNEKHSPAPQLLELKPDLLSNAIVNGDIKPLYQPKIDLQTGNIAGVEALARWQHTNKQSVSPAIFVPLAEKCNLISNLTLSILDQVLQDMVRWHEQGLEIPVAINLSAKSLSDRNLANDIISRVRKMGVPPEMLTFEITESALVVDLAEALANTSRLRLKGFTFSIDDYGTGFSSMQQLTRFPFSELKIDRSFVHGAVNREHLRSILQSAIDMGNRLNINTVAEGVETLQEFKLLQSMGCHHAQGFLISKPIPGKDIAAWKSTQLQVIAEICNSD